MGQSAEPRISLIYLRGAVGRWRAAAARTWRGRPPRNGEAILDAKYRNWRRKVSTVLPNPCRAGAIVSEVTRSMSGRSIAPSAHPFRGR